MKLKTVLDMITKYQNITKEDLVKAFAELATDGIAPTQKDREFVLYTGSDGADLILYEMRKANLISALEWLMHDCILVSQEQHDNLVKMINSPDRENCLLAEEIIKSKQKQWQSNLQQKTIDIKV